MFRLMKIIFFISFLVMLLNSLLLFSEETEEKSHFTPFSLQFRIYDLLNIDYYLGAVLSAKIHFNESHALRFGISLLYNYNEEKPDSGFFNAEYRFKIDVILDYLYYFINKSTIKPYIGAGVIGGTDIDGEAFEPVTNRHYRFNVGVNIFFGLEWFFIEHISLILEYGIIGQFYYKYYVITNNNVTKSTEISIEPNEIKLGISFYF